jgi:sensor histidine kinase YesM
LKEVIEDGLMINDVPLLLKDSDFISYLSFKENNSSSSSFSTSANSFSSFFLTISSLHALLALCSLFSPSVPSLHIMHPSSSSLSPLQTISKSSVDSSTMITRYLTLASHVHENIDIIIGAEFIPIIYSILKSINNNQKLFSETSCFEVEERKNSLFVSDRCESNFVVSSMKENILLLSLNVFLSLSVSLSSSTFPSFSFDVFVPSCE